MGWTLSAMWLLQLAAPPPPLLASLSAGVASLGGTVGHYGVCASSDDCAGVLVCAFAGICVQQDEVELARSREQRTCARDDAVSVDSSGAAVAAGKAGSVRAVSGHYGVCKCSAECEAGLVCAFAGVCVGQEEVERARQQQQQQQQQLLLQ
eukprot:SAG31_NODE_916_length_11047_cov_3.507033_6_plen_151_part_00